MTTQVKPVMLPTYFVEELFRSGKYRNDRFPLQPISWWEDKTCSKVPFSLCMEAQPE